MEHSRKNQGKMMENQRNIREKSRKNQGKMNLTRCITNEISKKNSKVIKRSFKPSSFCRTDKAESKKGYYKIN